jgi:hypothetical protein
VRHVQDTLLGWADLDTKHSLANVYLSLTDIATLLQQALCAWVRILVHRTLTAMHSLAHVCTSQSCYGDTENLLVRIMAACE